MGDENGRQVCSRCHARPRVAGQRWCRECRTEAQRDRRGRLRVQTSAPADVTMPSRAGTERELDETTSAPVVTDAPPRIRSDVLPDGVAAAAVARLRDVEVAYERARARDWRRSPAAPGIVLQPLADAVRRARKECQRLGMP